MTIYQLSTHLNCREMRASTTLRTTIPSMQTNTVDSGLERDMVLAPADSHNQEDLLLWRCGIVVDLVEEEWDVVEVGQLFIHYK